MEKSQSIKELSKALALFHTQVGKIKKDANNPFFKSKYATLSNILDVIQEPLQKSGLIFTQFPDGENGLTSILVHPESDQYLQATYNMHPVKNDPQSMGSAITYARRYALGAILGLNIDEDDDGNAASGKRKETDYLDEWQTELNKCKTLADITTFYNSNKEAVEADPKIKALFTKRKTQLK